MHYITIDSQELPRIFVDILNDHSSLDKTVMYKICNLYM